MSISNAHYSRPVVARWRSARRVGRSASKLMAGAAVILLCITSFPPAHASRVAACLQPSAPAAMQICDKVASEVSHDIAALRALGHELEIRGRHAEALRVYQIGIGVHAANRDLLRRSIRARANARAWRLLEDPASAGPVAGQPDALLAGQIDACHQQQFAAALEPCRRAVLAYPDDGALNERLGDVLRSVGRVDDAVQAYNASLIAGQASAARKRDALSRLVSTIGRRPPPLPPLEPALASSTPMQVGSAPSTTTTMPSLPLPKRLASEHSELALNARVSPANRPPAVLTRGVRRALVIGNETYRDFPRLATPLADVEAVARLLADHYGFSDVQRLSDATRYQILSELSSLRARAGADDQVLIYYAGHGYLDPTTSRGYWLPVDAQRDNLANWLSTSDITDTLAGLAARHAMVIADSCFSGSLLRAGGVIALDERVGLLSRLAARRSRTIMTSGGLEPVVDDGGGQHSVFAAALLNGLQNNTGVLEAGRLFVHVRDQVSLHAEQTPQYAPIRSAGHDGGDFLFVRTSR